MINNVLSTSEIPDNMYFRIRLSLLLGLIFCVRCFSQEFDAAFFQAEEINLIADYNAIINEKDEKEAKYLQDEFFNHVYRVINQENSWLYSFDSLKHIGRVISPNQKLIIYTWNFPKSFGYNDYYGIVQYNPKKGKTVNTYRLHQIKEMVEDPFLYICDTNKWVGALYYQIVETKYKGTECYTLLGYNFSNVLSNKKILDALCFGKDGSMRFEPNMFFYDNHICNRIEFEYAESAQMLLTYKPEMEKIVFDHLAPIRPSLEKQYQFYGPDASYDALYFSEGIWHHESNILLKY